LIRMRTHGVGLLLGATIILGGCSTTVIPPAKLDEPALVFLLDHGRHSTLVLSTPEDGLVRYAYGDWRFYAERLTGPGHAVAALLWNTPGALGRREMAGPATAAGVRAQVPLVITSLYVIAVERGRIDALRAELDAIFDAAAEPRDTPEVDLVFVPHPRDYNLRHNSTTVVAGWLEQLGCEIKGPAILARWRVMEPSPGGAR
jgi:hypothetical protein